MPSSRDGQSDLAEYIALRVFLRSARLIFDAFDPQRTGRITQLDFSQASVGLCVRGGLLLGGGCITACAEV